MRKAKYNLVHALAALGSLGGMLCFAPMGWAGDPDFSAGFKQLLMVGVPDTRGCKLVEYAAFQTPNQGNWGDDDSDNYEQRSFERSYDSDTKERRVWGWLTADGKHVIDGLTKKFPVLGADDAKAQQAKRDELQKRMESAGNESGTNPTLAKEISKDTAALAAGGLSTATKPLVISEIIQRYEHYFALRKVAMEKQKSRRYSQSYSDSPEASSDPTKAKPKPRVAWRSSPEILLLAAEIWRSGDEAAGNQLANLVLTNSEDPAQLLRQAVNRLAQEQYSDAISAFYTKQDWALLATQLEQIATRFPRDWSGATSVRILHQASVARTAQPTPPPPKLEGALATPENVALVTRIATEPPLEPRSEATSEEEPADVAAEENDEEFEDSGGSASLGQPRPLWFLNPPKLEKFEGPLRQILNRGLEAIPLLAACLNDPTLGVSSLPYWAMEYRYNDSREVDTGPSLPTTPEDIIAELQLGRLERPATRHEIVAPWLNALFRVGSSYSSDDEDDDAAAPDLKTRSMEFYEKWKAQPPLAILWSYFSSSENQENANQQLQLAAVPEILRLAPDDAPKLEAWLLKEPVLLKYEVFARYIETRGKAAEACYVAFATLARKELQDKGSGEKDLFGTSDDNAKKQLETKLKTLKAQLSGTGLTGLLDEVLSGKLTNAEASQSLYEVLGRKPPTEEMLNQFMAAAAKAESADSSSNLVYLLYGLHSMSRGDGKFPNWTKNTPEKIQVWERWLQDERPLSFHAAGIGPTKLALTVGQLGNQLAASSGDVQEEQMLAYAATYSRGSDPKDDFLVRRTRAWLAGEPLVKFEKLSDEETKSLLKTAGEQTAAGLPNWYAKLTGAQRIGVWLEAFKVRRFPPVWIEAAMLIHTMDEPADHPWAKAYDWASLQGQPLTTELCSKISAALIEQKAPPATVMIRQSPSHGALHLSFQGPLAGPDATSLTSARPPAGAVVVYALSYFGSGNALHTEEGEEKGEENGLANVFKQVTDPKSGPFGLAAVLAILPPLPDVKFADDTDTAEDSEPEPEPEETDEPTEEPATAKPDPSVK